jgi:beta-N-acetylhexosaminidase
MALVCNNPQSADELLGGLEWDISATSLVRLARMHGRPHPDSMIKLHEDASFVKAVREIGGIGMSSGDLPLG